jgi:hypothetical protein
MLKFPYEDRSAPNFGNIPIIKLSLGIKYSGGFLPLTFVFDTGAEVTSLPASTAEKLGINLSLCPQGIMKGYEGNGIIAYISKIRIKIDKKIIAGIMLGITIAAGTSVLAEDKPQSSGGFASSIANFFGVNNPNSNSPTTSAVSKELEAEAKKCATGADGTLGAAIKNATKIHLEIAAVAPPVEELFDGDCSSGEQYSLCVFCRISSIFLLASLVIVVE